MSDDALVFHLLGGHVIRLGDRNITLQLPHKGRALLVYLLLTEKEYARIDIALRLWPQTDADKALRSLRVLLNTLRNKYQLTPFIHSDRKTISLNFAQPTGCDVRDFEAAVTPQLNTADPDLAMLQAGMDLYLGKFMLGFDVTNTEFDDWLLQQQIRLEELALRGLVVLIEWLDKEGNPRAAAEYAYRLVAIDPWREASYRLLMCVLARSDRADAALFAYDQCQKTLARELGVMPEAETAVLADQIRAGAISVVQPEPEPTELPHAELPFLVPMVSGPFVGRQQIMARLTTALTHEDGRSRTCLTGMGGIGKTTVAQQTGYLLRDAFPDGVLWADAAQQERLSIADMWANAYGYDLHHVSNENERLFALRSILAEKNALIILDDVANAAYVRPLLPETGACQVLLTSRSEDVARLLDALPVPLQVLSLENGRSLLFHYLEPARAAREPQAVQTICRLLHNLPLAVVIAGNYLLERPQLRLVDFAAQLKTESQKLDIRHANRQVRASFNLSWEALHPDQKRWFRLLGVFNGRSFTVDAFAAVAELDLWEADAQLQNLVQLSLLGRTGNGRLRQHPLLAEFAREKLSAKDAAHLRMVTHYLTCAATYQTNYEWLHAEWENMNASIETASRLHQWHSVVQLTTLLQPAWFARGRYTEARQAFAYAVAAAMYQEDEQIVANTHFMWGQACLEQSDYQQAAAQFDKSLEIYQDTHNQTGIADVNYELSRISINQGRYDRAKTEIAVSRAIRQHLNDTLGLAETYYREARICYRQGKNEEAKKLCESILLMAENSQNRLLLIRTSRLLATISALLSEYDSAQRYAEKALSLAQKINDQGEIGMGYYALAIACSNRNEEADALSYAEKGLAILKQIGDIHSQGLILYEKCRILKSAAKYEPALTAANEALAFFHSLQDRYAEALTILHIGDCNKELGQTLIACEQWAAALEIAEKLNNQRLTQALQTRLTICA
ncbi:MAG: hypothetical protein KC421_14290 [Anaerolineales bacterium]|nr:hypothetical protein [Anaerolineales bacterium]